MKKFYLGLVLLLTSVCSYAFDQDNVTLTVYSSYDADEEEFADEINPIDMKAGDMAYVVCTLDNQSELTFQAFQLLITIPDGFQFDQIWDEDEEEYYSCKGLHELSRTNRWSLMSSNPTATTMKCLLWTNNPDKYEFPGKGKYEGNDLFYFIIKAAGTVPDFGELNVTDVLFSRSVETGEVDPDGKPIIVNEAYPFPNAYRPFYRVGQTGYATLCYNSASIDFSEGPLKANIAQNGHNGYAYLSPIEIVPAGTPIVVTGEAGSYELSVKYDDFVADPSIENNDLVGTPDAPYTVEGNNIFALASKTEGIGFYRCNQGVVIPRYKAYIESASSVEAMLFEETTGINQVKANDANNEVYTISGMKVDNTQRKGIYVRNGKKVVVK